MDAAEREQHDAELIVVVGPTASGKSSLAMDLAEQHGGEIVGADSVHVYRQFDIGSSKPSPRDRERVAHHLVDVVDPHDPMDAARYAELAAGAIADIRSRDKVPIVCGGTFLWVRALLYGLASAPRGDPALRARHAELAERDGRAALHARLAEVDPKSSAKLHANDLLRVSRALEVFEITGSPMSEWQAAHGFSELRYRVKMVGIRWSHDALIERIATRTRGALANGWIDEVRRLLALGYRDTRAMSSVGYRQVLAHVEGALTEDELPHAIDRATKVFARRQRTWLRDEDVEWRDGEALASR